MSKRLAILHKRAGIKNRRKLHKSNMMSEIGSLLVMMFVVAILLLYIDYSRIITAKIDMDNLNKNMLLIAEMQGGLSEEDMNDFYENLESMGIPKSCVMEDTNHPFPKIATEGQVPYGEQIIISYTVNLASPVYERFCNNSLFRATNASPTIPIHIYGKTVSKW